MSERGAERRCIRRKKKGGGGDQRREKRGAAREARSGENHNTLRTCRPVPRRRAEVYST